MDIPECREFKELYDKCFKDNISSKLMNWTFDPNAANKCDEPFQNYKDCVSVIMEKRIADKKKQK